jgi:hypothetical protein
MTQVPREELRMTIVEDDIRIARAIAAIARECGITVRTIFAGLKPSECDPSRKEYEDYFGRNVVLKEGEVPGDSQQVILDAISAFETKELLLDYALGNCDTNGQLIAYHLRNDPIRIINISSRSQGYAPEHFQGKELLVDNDPQNQEQGKQMFRENFEALKAGTDLPRG